MKRLALLFALMLGACGDSVTTPVRPQSALTGDLLFLQFTSDAFAAAQKSVSFWAVQGAGREVTLRYTDTGEEFLEFRVEDNSLAVHPDGRPVAPGDSVQITIKVNEAGRFIFQFEPSGLQFNPEKPARLRLNYRRTVRLPLVGSLMIWRHDHPVLPWFSVPTFSDEDSKARAEVQHFTEFGIAQN